MTPCNHSNSTELAVPTVIVMTDVKVCFKIMIIIIIIYITIIPRSRLGYEMIDLIDIYDRDDR